MTLTSTGLAARVKEALYQRVAAMVLTPVLTVVYWDDLEFVKPADNAAYIEARVFTSPPVDVSVGNDEIVQYMGFLQLTVVWPEGSGELPAAEVVSQLCDWFKKGTALSAGGKVILEVTRTPIQLSPSKEEPRVRYPVTIYYRAFG